MRAFVGCNTKNLDSRDVEVHFAHPPHLQWIRVKFVFEGHHVKVKVIGAIEQKWSKIPIPAR